MRAFRLVLALLGTLAVLPAAANDNSHSSIDPKPLLENTGPPNPNDTNYVDELNAQLAQQQAFLQQAEAALNAAQMQLNLAQQASQLALQLQNNVNDYQKFESLTGPISVSVVGEAVAGTTDTDLAHAVSDAFTTMDNIRDALWSAVNNLQTTLANSPSANVSAGLQAAQAQLQLVRQLQQFSGQLQEQINGYEQQVQQLSNAAQQNFATGQMSQGVAAQAQLAVISTTSVEVNGSGSPFDVEQTVQGLERVVPQQTANIFSIAGNLQFEVNALQVVVTRAQADVAQTQAQIDAALNGQAPPGQTSDAGDTNAADGSGVVSVVNASAEGGAQADAGDADGGD